MRRLYISQSAIKDFLACKERYYYRLNYKNKSVSTKEMFLGTLVHELLENFSEDKIKAVQETYRVQQQNNLSDADLDVLQHSVVGFFDNFYHLVTPDDEKEIMFTIPYEKNVYLTGKFDRITPAHLVIDWKSGTYVPLNLQNDVQSIIYNYAYERIHGIVPTIVVGYLRANKLKYYSPDKLYIDMMFNEILPDMLDNIQNGSFTHTGLFTGSCRRCTFKEFCFEQMEN